VYFYTLRAAEHVDSDLVNMLMAELYPADIRQLFICHKKLFYSTYAQWSDTKKTMLRVFWNANTKWTKRAHAPHCSVTRFRWKMTPVQSHRI